MYRLYTKPSCPHCIHAKNLLRSTDREYVEIVVGVDCTVEELKDLVPGVKTVPQIFDEDVYVGGFTELKEYLK